MMCYSYLGDIDEILVSKMTALGVCELERLNDAVIRENGGRRVGNGVLGHLITYASAADVQQSRQLGE